MAPTVCSAKKVRVAGRKEVQRRGSMGMSQTVNATASNTAPVGVTQSSTVLSYVAKGSMHSGRRQHRRRVIRLPRVKPISKSPSAARNKTRRAIQVERRQLDEFNHGDFNETSIQILRTHSSSANFKTVLQPTTANNNSSKHSNKMPKHCDQMLGMDDDQLQDSEDEQGDNDSGYDFAMGPSKYTHSQQPNQHQQCHTHNDGLLSIALKTIKLVQRNKLLQKRLAQLQLETSEFIASVLANPENRHYREKITTKTDAANKVSNVLLRH